MGRAKREKPKKLAKKLKTIREKMLGYSQTEMAKALGLKINYSAVSQYERGTREPTLPIIVKYAELIGLSTDYIINDKLDLPK
jgi:transcriptional regulator with XRE-family HTH domain